MYKLMIAEDEEPIRRGLVYTIPWKKWIAVWLEKHAMEWKAHS